MYEQTLVKKVDSVRLNTIKRLNKSKKWEYGYNKENDIVVISKTGQIGEVLEIQGLKIALPLAPKSIYKRSDKKKEQKWGRFDFNPAFSISARVFGPFGVSNPGTLLFISFLRRTSIMFNASAASPFSIYFVLNTRYPL